MIGKGHLTLYKDILLFIVAAHGVVITMTEDMIEAMMIGTTIADHTGKLTISFKILKI